MKCETCKDWKITNMDCEWWDHDTQEEIKPHFKMGKCKSDKLTFLEMPLESNWGMLKDGSGYAAGLYTGQDFYCGNWRGME